jgi:hypothetical protein
MSTITAYIRATLANQTFEEVKQHFEAKNCRVLEDETTYMVISPLENAALDVLDAVGTILSKADNRIVCFGFPRTVDVTEDPKIDGSIVATEYLGGSLIRAYYHNGSWRLSTNGAIDAYDNFWISKKSIGSLFDEMLCKIYRQSTTFAESPLAELLNRDYSYQFILQHPEIHLEMAERPMLFHVGTFDNTAHVYLDDARAHRLPQPQIVVFNSFSEILTAVKKMDSKSFGFTFTSGANHQTQHNRYKLLTKSFVQMQKLIGRTGNLYLRYLEAKAEGVDSQLIQAFPSIRYYAGWVDKSTLTIAKEVVRLYIEKFVKKNHATPINFYLRPIIAAAHEKYQQNRVNVSIDTVMKQLLAEHPKRMNFVLNGLGYIKTNDVRLPESTPAAAAAPAAAKAAPKPSPKEEFPELPKKIVVDPPTEQEVAELDQAIEVDLWNQPYRNILAQLSYEERMYLLRQEFMSFIQAEIEIAWESNVPVYMDMAEQIFFRLNELDEDDIAMCLEDNTILIDNIRQLIAEAPMPDPDFF